MRSTNWLLAAKIPVGRLPVHWALYCRLTSVNAGRRNHLQEAESSDATEGGYTYCMIRTGVDVRHPSAIIFCIVLLAVAPRAAMPTCHSNHDPKILDFCRNLDVAFSSCAMTTSLHALHFALVYIL